MALLREFCVDGLILDYQNPSSDQDPSKAAIASAFPLVIQAAAAHNQNPCRPQAALPGRADLSQLFLPGVAVHRVASSHWRVRASGSSASKISVTTAALSAPASKTPGSRSGVSPPMATRGRSPTRAFQRFSFSKPCGAQGIFLSF